MSYVVSTAGAESVEALCSLFETVFHQSVQPSEWRWKYEDPSTVGHENVILFDDDTAVVGHAGAVIHRGSIAGRLVPVAQICDVMLSPRVRGQAGPAGAYAALMNGLSSRLQERIPEGLYYGFPGLRPFKLGERLGFYRGTGRIREWQCPVGAFASSRWRWRRLQPLDWNDPLVDRLWREHARRHQGIVILDRRYLGWRYARNPFHTYHLFAVSSGWRQVGCVVVARDGDVLRCVERIVDDVYLSPMLGLLARYGRSIGVDKVAWWSPADAAFPTAASQVKTELEGTVVTFSAPAYASILPSWQPGDVDVY